MGTILAIPDDGERRTRVSSGDRLLRSYRSYRKVRECVYAEFAKVVAALAG
jgi:hypothetical protein